MTHSDALCEVPEVKNEADVSEILYTDTPRLLSSPTYSAMSASPALSAHNGSQAAKNAAAEPAAQGNAVVNPSQPTNQLVWEAESDKAHLGATSTAEAGRYTASAVAALISPGASCCLPVKSVSSTAV